MYRLYLHNTYVMVDGDERKYENLTFNVQSNGRRTADKLHTYMHNHIRGTVNTYNT